MFALFSLFQPLKSATQEMFNRESLADRAKEKASTN
jgi:hypothetical protein